MLFFRSEEAVRAWCREHKSEVRPILDLETQWRLALAWYGDRLQPDAHRPGPAEMRDIFSALGLEGPFWDPEADEF